MTQGRDTKAAVGAICVPTTATGIARGCDHVRRSLQGLSVAAETMDAVQTAAGRLMQLHLDLGQAQARKLIVRVAAEAEHVLVDVLADAVTLEDINPLQWPEIRGLVERAPEDAPRAAFQSEPVFVADTLWQHHCLTVPAAVTAEPVLALD